MWVDIACPWCYLGKHRMEQGIAAFEHPHEVEVRFRSFQLDPRASTGQGRVVDRLAARYRGPDGVEEMTSRVREAAEAEGLVIDLGAAVQASTFDGHRLVHLARDVGGPALQAAALERLFSAHFAEGRAVDDVEVLQRLGAEAGLDERMLGEMLAGHEYADDIRADIAEAKVLGVRSVPTAVANRRLALAGAQAPEATTRLLQQAWRDLGA